MYIVIFVLLYFREEKMDRTMLKDGSKYITFIKRRLFSPVLLKTVSLIIVLIFFAMLSLQIEEIKGKFYTNNYIFTMWLLVITIYWDIY